LYTARRLVEAMGGSLSMGSDDEPSATGAVLTIVLAAPDDA
ncbi:MAG: hypothetical protein JWN41_1782, partial [Thermoleophilia bacterium]|nr:hypothetical protein [Thermoleophilia bacterium]